MPTDAVTGATGHLGGLAIEELLRRGVAAADVVAVARTPQKAAHLADRGVDVREGDYARPDTLAGALKGVDRLLLVSGSEAGQRVAQHAAVIEAAVAAGVTRIAYTSILNADDTTNPLAGEHQETERVLRDAGVPYTLLRNSWYVENYTGQVGDYAARGEIVGAAGSGHISAATRQDFAVAAVAALLQDSDNHTYELGGPGFTLAELAQAVTDATGEVVTYRDLSPEAYAGHLQQAGLDEGTAQFVAAIDASIARGDLETRSGDLERLLGRPATPLAEVLRAAPGA